MGDDADTARACVPRTAMKSRKPADEAPAANLGCCTQHALDPLRVNPRPETAANHGIVAAASALALAYVSGEGLSAEEQDVLCPQLESFLPLPEVERSVVDAGDTALSRPADVV